jgi:hypothetical protein
LRITTTASFLGVLKVGIDKVITPSLRRIQKGRAPLLATVVDPVLKLLSDLAQAVASNPLPLPIGIKLKKPITRSGC